jgi:hypothetical protein
MPHIHCWHYCFYYQHSQRLLTPLPHPLSDILHSFNPSSVSSGDIHYHCVGSLAQQLYTGLLYCPCCVGTWSSAKNHLKCCSFKWFIKGLLIGMFSYEVISMTTSQYLLHESEILSPLLNIL